MSDGRALGDAAEDKFEDGAIQMAKTRAAAFLRAAADAALSNPWRDRAAAKWLIDDKAQLVIDTNQGRFVVTIERG